MTETLGRVDAGSLDRSCSPGRDSIRLGVGADGMQPMQAYFSATGFEPHRHDTYGIGITVAGVQAFRYRGERRVCLPGQLHILHPDEVHDGGAATSAGFGYRIVYVRPQLIRDALGGRALPFVADPVHDPTPPSATTWTRTPASRRRLARLSRSPASTASRSLGSSAAPTGPARTGTARC